jgi:predicted regulator of Ras-like GTPase activity (Roadblock/LC7/MglB family)
MSTLRDKLVEILHNLSNSGIINSRVVTEDGFVVASSNIKNQINDENSNDIGAISASIMSMAEKSLEILNENVMLEQIKIDVGIDENIEHDFTIIIERICANLLLQVLFEKRINIGEIHYKINMTISNIKKIINDINLKELFIDIV